MRLIPDGVQEATARWMSGQPLRELHQLVEQGGSAAAEAYVLGQTEVMGHLIRLQRELEAVRSRLGTPRKLASAAATKLIKAEFVRARKQNPEWGPTKIAKDIAGAVDCEDWRTVLARLHELRLVLPGGSLSFTAAIQPASPLAAWILAGR